MPVLGGFEAARRIRKKLPEVAIVILSSEADRRKIGEAKKIGVRAFVPKTRRPSRWLKPSKLQSATTSLTL
jgi:DNA-binding NarL/FixJ family response regulator